MAHECFDCSAVCHCGGDIDDMVMSGTSEELRCTHDCTDDDYEEMWGEDEYDCLGCGTCATCVERAINYAEEMAAASDTEKGKG
jgi:coenzyme F420-reducing hydrogenase gamma subunit